MTNDKKMINNEEVTNNEEAAKNEEMTKHEKIVNILRNIVPIIEEELAKEKSVEYIYSVLRGEAEESFVYCRFLFNHMSKYPLMKYIRRRELALLFMKWKAKPVKLIYKDIYYGVYKFKHKFRREFGLTLEEAAQKGYTDSDLQCVLDMEDCFDKLKKLVSNPLCARFRIVNDGAEIRFDRKWLLLLQLSIPVFVFSDEVYNILQEEDNEERTFHILYYLHKDELEENPELKILDEEFQRISNQLSLYDFEHAAEIEDKHVLVKSAITQDLKQEFIELADIIWKYTDMAMPWNLMPEALKKLIEMIIENECRKKVGMPPMIDEEYFKELLWDLYNFGYVRLTEKGVYEIGKLITEKG